jgi:16S rRNA (cytosine1402-N4)-methyltransferase
VATFRNLSHEPVLYEEIIHALHPTSPGLYVDGTVGAGGHARGLLEACAPDGKVLGLDVDSQALALARKNLASYEPRVMLTQASYSSLLEVMRSIGWPAVDGIVLDLGVSTMQLEAAERGFSFRHDAPLDMRFDAEAGLSAADVVNTMPEAELADILFRFGEERHAKRIARLIVASRPVSTTTELAAIVERAYRGRTRIHPATRTFQALRIVVNDELTSLQQGLPPAIDALRSGGRLAVISFHSLEDRMVKTFIRQRSGARSEQPDLGMLPAPTSYERPIKEVTRKPIVPTDEEIQRNPRARSAKLRVAEKL